MVKTVLGAQLEEAVKTVDSARESARGESPMRKIATNHQSRDRSIESSTLRATSRESSKGSLSHLKEYKSQFPSDRMKMRIQTLTSVSPHFKTYLPNNFIS